MLKRSLNGFLPVTKPATTYWIMRMDVVTANAKTMILRHPPPIIASLPLAVRSAITVRMYTGRSGITADLIVSDTAFRISLNVFLKYGISIATMASPNTNDATRAVVISMSGGIVKTKYAGKSLTPTTLVNDPSSIFGKVNSETLYAKPPANRVETYASPIVARSSLPAPLPVSAIAGVTRPITMNGTKNLMNWPNVPPNELSARMTAPGARYPIATPITIAMNSFPTMPIFSFILFFSF